jgi:uncharacterized membrane protein YebE (DUF533 family)
MDLSYFDRIAISQFSSLEKECIYQVVCAAMIVDGEKDPKELQLLNDIVNVIGLTPSERAASRSLDEPTMTRTIRNMDEFKRAYVGKFIAQMLLADEKITQKEQLFFDYLVNRLNLPQL